MKSANLGEAELHGVPRSHTNAPLLPKYRRVLCTCLPYDPKEGRFLMSEAVFGTGQVTRLRRHALLSLECG